jgi:tetratricopeptide (TPR) repeat protein
LSLLLDALKRAEQEKLAKQGGSPGEPERLAPVALAVAPPPASARAPNLELQPLNAVPLGAAGVRSDAQAAQNVFQAKEAATARAAATAAAAGAPGKKNPMLWIVLGIIAVALLGIGGYVWYAVSSFTPRAPIGARPRPAPIATTAIEGTGTPMPIAPKVEAFVPTQQPSTAIQPGPQTVATVAVDTPAKERTTPPPVPESERVRETVAALLRESSTPATTPPLKLMPSRETARVSPDVVKGYRDLVAGDLQSAHKNYTAALDADPLNLDALLGVATIEARTGNRMLALNHYRRVLDIDPRNATALAGLAAVSEYARAEGAESQLRNDLAVNPGSAGLHFTLGNLFATQLRWGEAQVEYFEAYRIDPANADYAFNLAVSLDRLRQPKLAAEYYTRALEAARNQATQFDPQSAARRLAELKN